MIKVLQGTKCVLWTLKWSKLTIVGTVRASPITYSRKLNFYVQKVFPQAPGNFLLVLGYEKSPESMKTVLQCAKCVFWPFKWTTLAIVGTVRASHIQENSVLMSKKYFH